MTASENLQFELAKEYRDLIRSIEYVTAKQNVQFGDYKDRDILGYFIDKGYISIQLFFMREGKLLYHDFNLEPVGEDFEEDLIRFLVTYYQTHPEPYELLIPQDVDLELLTEILSCHVLQPQRGDKKSLVEMANKNAKEALEKKFLLKEKTDEKTILPIIELGQKLGIDTPHTIELYDNSNIQGAYAVAGMVVYKDGVPSKKDYRKYKIKTVEGPDDYASMKEVLTRRFSRAIVEQSEGDSKTSFSKLPDIILMDGGRGQVNICLKVLKELNLHIPVAGMVKDDTHSTRGLYYNNVEMPISTRSEGFKLITRIQDEAHRFAIEYHKKLRSKVQVNSVLDDIKGVGPARRKALMKYFMDIDKIRNADVDELLKVDGMTATVAQAVYNYFH